MTRTKHILLYFLIAILFGIVSGVKPSFASFTVADLQGTWRLHILTTLGEWMRGSASIDGSGNLSFTAETSEGDPGETTSVIIISSNGIITMTDSPSLQGMMSTDKNFFALTETMDDEENEYALFLGVKQDSASFTPADLAGTWHGHDLASGAWEGWVREIDTIDGVGNLTPQWIDSDGYSETDNPVKVDISSDGIITTSAWEPLQGILNNSRNLIVITNTRTEGVCEMGIIMKEGISFSPLDLAGTWYGYTLFVGEGKGWSRTNLVFDTAGNYSVAYIDSDGNSGMENDSINISNTGIITKYDSPTLHGVMNTDKNIIAMTETWEDNVYAFTVFVKSERTRVSGSISFEGTPLCAMVLVNGEYMFSCPPDNSGVFDLEVPLDNEGEITVQAFAAGFAPYKAVITPDQSQDFDINMTRAAADSREIELMVNTEPGTTSSEWSRIWGTVTYDEQDLCAMVLANGQSMFSCPPDNSGVFELEVPLDGNGEITLQVFAAGFAPYREVFMP